MSKKLEKILLAIEVIKLERDRVDAYMLSMGNVAHDCIEKLDYEGLNEASTILLQCKRYSAKIRDRQTVLTNKAIEERDRLERKESERRSAINAQAVRKAQKESAKNEKKRAKSADRFFAVLEKIHASKNPTEKIIVDAILRRENNLSDLLDKYEDLRDCGKLAAYSLVYRELWIRATQVFRKCSLVEARDFMPLLAKYESRLMSAGVDLREIREQVAAHEVAA